MRKILTKYPYLFLCLLSLICFVGVVGYVWQDVEDELSNKTEAMLKDVALSNINIVTSELNKYDKEALTLQQLFKLTLNQKIIAEKMLPVIQKQDNTIKEISVRNVEILGEKRIEFVDNNKILRWKFPLKEQKSTLIIDVDLLKLHTAIAEHKDLLHAYVSVACNGRYVFHPDENLLGEKVDIKEQIPERKMTQHYSEFLQMDVFSYTTRHAPLTFTANVLKIDIQELLQKRGRALAWILATTLLTFIVIVTLGFMRWRREFLKRKNAEQQNLELALKNEQQKQASVSTELEILKSGLNPHFLFNAMSSLKILVKKQPELAKDFAVALSNVYRYLLKHEKEDTVHLSEEIEFVNDYVLLQKIRFGESIQLQMNLNDSLIQRQVPPVSLQLLIENAIKHTTISKETPLQISIYSDETYLIVKNNYKPRLSEIKHTGKGIDNLQKRYALLTPKLCSFQVENDKYIASIPILD